MIDPIFSAQIQEVVDEQGWDDNKVLGLALDYIADPPVRHIVTGATRAFVDYLRAEQDAQNGNRTVVVTTFAECTVMETWTLSVPKGFEVDDDNALDLLGGDDYPEVRIVNVADEVDNEQDRTLISIEEDEHV